MERRLIRDVTRERLVERFGPWVLGWCASLPAQVEDSARKWGFRVIGPVSRGRNSCVLLCERDTGSGAVLKLTPDPSLGVAEFSALVAWQDSGRVPRLFEFDDGSGTIFMEAIRPGTAFAHDSSRVRLGEVARLVRDLHDGPGDEILTEFPPLIERVEFIFAFLGGLLAKPAVASVVSANLLKESLVKARGLAMRPGPRVLLHGDLHPGNVLDGEDGRGPVAIDPRACVGDPAFDLIDWALTASWAEGGDESALIHRARWLAGEAGADPDSLIRWCRCTAVLVAIARLSRGDAPASIRPLLRFAADGS